MANLDPLTSIPRNSIYGQHARFPSRNPDVSLRGFDRIYRFPKFNTIPVLLYVYRAFVYGYYWAILFVRAKTRGFHLISGCFLRASDTTNSPAAANGASHTVLTCGVTVWKCVLCKCKCDCVHDSLCCIQHASYVCISQPPTLSAAGRTNGASK